MESNYLNQKEYIANISKVNMLYFRQLQLEELVKLLEEDATLLEEPEIKPLVQRLLKFLDK